MSYIRAGDGCLTLFNIFHTTGRDGQDRLFAQWRSLPPASTQPGLIAGNFHRSFDGRSVINYAQWESKEHYDAFIAHSGTQSRLGEALTFSRMESVPCEVVHTWDPVLELSLEKPWFTVVVVVRSSAEHQARVLEEMTADDPDLGSVPGYVSHVVHRGLDGKHVIKYAQWQDEESLHAFLDKPRQASPLDSLTTSQLHFCRLEYIRGRS